MTFEISFLQMTHDSLSAVKIKQTLYGSHHAARLGNKEHKWCFCVHACVPTHTCTKKPGREVYYQRCFRASKWLSITFSGPTVKIYRHQSTYTFKIKSPPPLRLSVTQCLAAPPIHTLKRADVTLNHHFHFLDAQSFSSSLVCQVPASGAKTVEVWR